MIIIRSLILFLFISINVLGLSSPGTQPVDSYRFTYVMHKDLLKDQLSIIKLDAIHGRIIDRIPTKEPFSTLTLNGNDGIFMTATRKRSIPQNTVFYFDYVDKSIKEAFTLSSYLPTLTFEYLDTVFTLTGGYSSSDLHINTYHSPTKQQDAHLLNQQSFLSNHALLFISPQTSHLPLSKITSHDVVIGMPFELNTSEVDTPKHNHLIVFDLIEQRLIYKIPNILSDYAFAHSILLHDTLPLLYVAMSGMVDRNNRSQRMHSNSDVLLCQFPSMNIVERITVPAQIEDMVMAPNERKLYVAHREGLSVINTQSHNIIHEYDDLLVKFIQYVGNSRIIVTHLVNEQFHLSIIDTQSEKILRTFEGHYGAIAASFIPPSFSTHIESNASENFVPFKN